MNNVSRIYVAGHRGLVGSAIVRCLEKSGYENIITRTSVELDLTDQVKTEKFFMQEEPEYVFLSAARVGGIHANSTYPAEFIYNNLQIQNNIMRLSHKHCVKKLLFLGSSCIYPKYCPQPMEESSLLTGVLEPTNKPYAIAKIAGIIMCQSYNKQYGTDFISVMPTNLYGENDNYHFQDSHVLPALIRRVHEAKISDSPEVIIWGTGNPLREFLYSDDLANACVFLMNNYSSSEIINIGSGQEVSIGALAQIVKKVIEYTGELVFDVSKPDGTPRKLLNSEKIRRLGWEPKISLEEGIKKAYLAFLKAYDQKW